LYREDQHSYLLYPNREITSFLERNTLPVDAAERCPLISELVQTGDTSLIVQDAEGRLHFNGDIANEVDILSRLNKLDASPDAAAPLLELWEELFQHHAFTGRSGRFFAFEGLGSIYWHMIAKLLLAVQEACMNEEDPAVQKQLTEVYEDVRNGLGFTKTAKQYGAFPTDPYSHTPAHIGAQQPGMTGQVKEEILTRLGELGAVVKDGCITFNPVLLKNKEFPTEPMSFSVPDTDGVFQTLELPAESLAFTLCQVPVVLTKANRNSIIISCTDGSEQKIDGLSMDTSLSQSVFARDERISKIHVHLTLDA
jgi:hypothetical protein